MKEIDKSQINVSSNRVWRVSLILIGWLCVALGVIGIFLPVMPTTVFLLIAAACFARSSEKFYVWLLTNKYLGKFVLNFREKRGMTIKSKIIALTTLTLVLGYTIIFAIDLTWLQVLLTLLYLSISAYILSLKIVD
jgi:uncharacterized membrane protein YbaN (DUF454 family)